MVSPEFGVPGIYGIYHCIKAGESGKSHRIHVAEANANWTLRLASPLKLDPIRDIFLLCATELQSAELA